MRRVVALLIGVLAIVWLSGSPASASTLADCLTSHHVCVTSDGRTLVSTSQQDQLEQEIGQDDIYLVVAVSGSPGYDAAMNQIISTLGGQKQQFVVGYLDAQQRHFGAYNQGVLASGGAATLATAVVQQHQSDRDIFAALQQFVRDVQAQAGLAADGWAPPDGGPSRMVPACIDCQRQVEQGLQPEMRTVRDSSGSRVVYVNSGFAPAYWGGFGYGGGMLTGFLLGEALAGPVFVADGYGYGDQGYFGGGNFGDGGDNFGGGDFGGGGADFGGGGFGGGDIGGDSFGGGDFGGGSY